MMKLLSIRHQNKLVERRMRIVSLCEKNLQRARRKLLEEETKLQEMVDRLEGRPVGGLNQKIIEDAAAKQERNAPNAREASISATAGGQASRFSASVDEASIITPFGGKASREAASKGEASGEVASRRKASVAPNLKVANKALASKPTKRDFPAGNAPNSREASIDTTAGGEASRFAASVDKASSRTPLGGKASNEAASKREASGEVASRRKASGKAESDVAPNLKVANKVLASKPTKRGRTLPTRNKGAKRLDSPVKEPVPIHGIRMDPPVVRLVRLDLPVPVAVSVAPPVLQRTRRTAFEEAKVGMKSCNVRAWKHDRERKECWDQIIRKKRASSSREARSAKRQRM